MRTATIMTNLLNKQKNQDSGCLPQSGAKNGSAPVIFTKEQITLRICKLIVRLIRNHVEEDRGGPHTRIFTHMLHPEQDYVLTGISSNFSEGKDRHVEHVVPCVVMISMTKELIQEGRLSDEQLAILMMRNWKVAILTKEEAKTIDQKLGLKTRMPESWSYEHGDPMARLTAAGITLISSDL